MRHRTPPTIALRARAPPTIVLRNARAWTRARMSWARTTREARTAHCLWAATTTLTALIHTQLHTSDMRLARRSLALGRTRRSTTSVSRSPRANVDVCGDVVVEAWVVRRRVYPGRKPLFPKQKRLHTGKSPEATWSKVVQYCQNEEKDAPR